MNRAKWVLPILTTLALGTSHALAADAPKASTESGGASAALSEDECRAIWNLAAGRSDLSLAGATPYIDSFEAVDTNRDKKISNSEFKAGCQAGHVHKLRRSE